MKRHEKYGDCKILRGPGNTRDVTRQLNTFISLVIYHRLPKLKIWLQRLKKTHKIAIYRLGNHTGKTKVSLADFCF